MDDYSDTVHIVVCANCKEVFNIDYFPSYKPYFCCRNCYLEYFRGLKDEDD